MYDMDVTDLFVQLPSFHSDLLRYTDPDQDSLFPSIFVSSLFILESQPFT